MRITEAIKHIFNKFFRQQEKIVPEENQKEPEESKLPEEIPVGLSDTEKKIRKYRAYAYHHKKKRIRKKYLKKLVEISPKDRLANHLKGIGMTVDEYSEMMTFHGAWNWVCGYSAGYFGISLNSIGSASAFGLYEYYDSRMKGGVR